MALRIHTFCDGSTLDLTVEVGLLTTGASYAVWDVAIWDTSLWGVGEVWTDVSAYVMGVNISRQFSRDLRIWQAGTMSVELNNQDGRFSPDNILGPYVVAGRTSIRPGCGIRTYLTYRSVRYWLFTGSIDEWAEKWEAIHGPRTGTASTELSCTDAWANISKAEIAEVSPAVGVGDSFGVRIARILTAANVTNPVTIDGGTGTMQGTTYDESPESLITLTADSEGGAVYIEADGTVIGKRQYSLVEDARATIPQATFGDAGGTEIPWSTISVAPYNLDNLVNMAAYTRVGGAQQVYRDVESNSIYGIISDKGSNVGQLICETDSQVLALAQWSVISRKDPETPITALSPVPLCDPDVLAALLALRVRDLVEVIRRPPSSTSHTVTRYCFVNGLQISIEAGNVSMGLGLYPATKYLLFSGSRWDVAIWDSSLWFT